MERRGKLILVMGPSGSGKGSLLAFLRSRYTDIVFPTTWTTRPPREGERDNEPNTASGKTYHFVSREVFTDALKAGAFLESAEYGGNWYGTPKAEVMDALGAGKTVLQELEIQGVRQIKAALSDTAPAVIFIDAGSWDNLKRRILSRGPMEDEELEKRRKRYEEEIASKPEADFMVENREGALEAAQESVAQIIDMIRNG